MESGERKDPDERHGLRDYDAREALCHAGSHRQVSVFAQLCARHGVRIASSHYAGRTRSVLAFAVSTLAAGAAAGYLLSEKDVVPHITMHSDDAQKEAASAGARAPAEPDIAGTGAADVGREGGSPPATTRS